MSDLVSKFQPNQEYLIIEYKSFNTSFGVGYVLDDEKFDKYFANKKVEQFIKENKIQNKGGEVLFKVITGSEKTFMKDGKELKYIDCRVLKMK